MLKELVVLKEENNENAIVQLQTDQKKVEATTQPIISNYDGFMARINSLEKLPWLPSFFIFLLFLAIETAPIFAKLISPKGEYDYRLEDEEAAVKTWTKQQVHQHDALLNADEAINEKVYADLQDDNDIYIYKRKKAQELIQDQTDAFYKKQKRLLS